VGPKTDLVMVGAPTSAFDVRGVCRVLTASLDELRHGTVF